MNGRETFTNELSRGLSKIYRTKLPDCPVWIDCTDPAYIANHLVERSVAALATELSGEMIDVGCGRQPYRQYFGHIKRILACDFDAKRGNVDFACPAHAIPVAGESLDSILCTEVLEHVPDPLAVWREFNRVLRPCGRVLLSTPMYWPPHELPYDFYRYPEHGLRYLVSSAGFEILELIPRGGRWAMFGQVSMHVMSRQLKLRMIRYVWNQTFLWIDRNRNTPDVTLGWTILAQKAQR